MAANKKKATARHTEDTPVKSFLDMIAPSVVQFNPDHFICGNTFRCVWALREYPTQTDEQALLRHLGEKDGITLRIYTRQLTPAEEKRIIQNAANKNRMGSSNTNDLQQTITAESNLQDMISMEGSRHRNKEPLFHCAVYIELTASDHNTLKLLQTDVLTELVRSKLNVDRLLLRQQQGFCCASPVGYNAFGAQFERVLPASSVANLYPFNYSGKTDAKGFYVGRDKYGSNILVDFDQRDEDKTSANILKLFHGKPSERAKKGDRVLLIRTIQLTADLTVTCPVTFLMLPDIQFITKPFALRTAWEDDRSSAVLCFQSCSKAESVLSLLYSHE